MQAAQRHLVSRRNWSTYYKGRAETLTETVRETEGGNGHCGAHHLQSRDKSFTVTIQKWEEANWVAKEDGPDMLRRETNKYMSPEMCKYQY